MACETVGHQVGWSNANDADRCIDKTAGYEADGSLPTQVAGSCHYGCYTANRPQSQRLVGWARPHMYSLSRRPRGRSDRIARHSTDCLRLTVTTVQAPS